MIDYTEIRRLIENKVEETFSTLPVEAENTFIDPEDSEHVKLVISDASSEPIYMGSSSRLVRGLITAVIMVHRGTGTTKIRTVASQLCAILKGSDTIPGITFNDGEAELIPVGALEDDSIFYQYNLVIPMMFEYTDAG